MAESVAPPLPRASSAGSPQNKRVGRPPQAPLLVTSTSNNHPEGLRSPIRVPSPGLGHIVDRDTYWTVTSESGCVPAMHFGYSPSTGQWWGGKFGAPLDVLEAIIEELPQVIASKSLDERIKNLEEIELYASAGQKQVLESNEVVSTGPGHSSTCGSKAKKRPIVVLNNDVERERCFALYAYLANAYVFSRERPNASAPVFLPAVISVPLCRLANFINRRPITDYACSVLNNWEMKDPNAGFTVENLRCPRLFTGLESERWFFNIHAIIEKQGGEALISMLRAKEEISQFLINRKLMGTEVTLKRAVALQRLLGHSKQYSVTAQDEPAILLSPSAENQSNSFEENSLAKARRIELYMNGLIASLHKLTETLKRLPDRCPPEEFFDKIRIWVSSWPEPGVVYQTYCDCGVDQSRRLLEPQKFAGASGAQSTLLPSIDGFLGIAYGHRQNLEATPHHARTDLGAFIRQLKSFRLSMPSQHRDLVARFEGQGTIRDFIDGLEEYLLLKRQALTSSSVPTILLDLDTALINVKKAYNATIEILTAFRKTHMDFAVTYIKQMAIKRGDPGGTAGTKGTGGSDYSKHLGQHVVDTKSSHYDIKELFPRDGDIVTANNDKIIGKRS